MIMILCLETAVFSDRIGMKGLRTVKGYENEPKKDKYYYSMLQCGILY